MKRVATIVAGQAPPSDEVVNVEDGSLPFLQGNAEFGVRNPRAHWSCDTAPKRASVGDILVSVRAPVGALNVADRSYGIGRGLAAVCVDESVNRNFAWWCMNASVPLLRAAASGSTYESVTAENIGEVQLPLPSLLKQRRIADFLDSETARIDALIARKRRMIDLMYERFLAFVAQRTRESRRRIAMRRIVSRVQTGATPSSSMSYGPRGHLDAAIEWMSPEDIGPLLEIAPTVREVQRSARPVVFLPGSIVIVGIGATAGKVGFVDREVAGNQQMTGISMQDEVVARHVAWELWCRRDELIQIAPFTTLPILSNEFLRSLDVHWPTSQDARRVVGDIDRRASDVKRAGMLLRRQVGLLQERRQSLITHTVIGQMEIPA